MPAACVIGVLMVVSAAGPAGAKESDTKLGDHSAPVYTAPVVEVPGSRGGLDRPGPVDRNLPGGRVTPPLAGSVQGRTPAESTRGSGMRAAGGGGVDDHKTAPPVQSTFTNPNAGSTLAQTRGQFLLARDPATGKHTLTFVRSMYVLTHYTTVTPIYTPSPAPASGPALYIAGYRIDTAAGEFSWMPARDLADAFLKLTGGQYSHCDSRGSGAAAIDCYLYAPPSPIPDTHPLSGWPASEPDARPSGPPPCAGVVVDGSVGVESRVDVSQVGCAWTPGFEADRLFVEYVDADPSLGIPRVAEDGAIRFTPTVQAQGEYVRMLVWAMTKDGQSSWPFWVVIRNRFAPQINAPTSIEAVRGVERVVSASELFSDVDVDHYATESGDELRLEVVGSATWGGAWFDAAGDLHYRSMDALDGARVDSVTVRATDRFGGTVEATLRVDVSDVRPSCPQSGSVTDAATSVRVVLGCTLEVPDGYRSHGAGLTYQMPTVEHGTISGFDPIAGVFTYVPDPEHSGPVIVRFTADNNGASRQGQHTINVLPAPHPAP